MLHDFDVSSASQTCGATLRSVIHDCDLPFFSSSFWTHVNILDSNGWCNRIEISWDCVVCYKWILLSEIQSLIYHLKTISIDVHLTSSVEAIQESPVDDDVFSYFVGFDWDFVKFNRELHKIFNAVKVDSSRGSDSLVLGLSFLPDKEEFTAISVLSPLNTFLINAAIWARSWRWNGFLGSVAIQLCFGIFGICVSLFGSIVWLNSKFIHAVSWCAVFATSCWFVIS